MRHFASAPAAAALGAGAFLLTHGGDLGVELPGADVSAAVGVAVTSIVALILGLTSMFGPLKSLADYVAPEEDEANASQHAESRRQIEKTVARITQPGRRLVLFIDDLERSPERTLDVLDIVESLFSLPSCVTVIPTDMDVLGDAIEQHTHIRNDRQYLATTSRASIGWRNNWGLSMAVL